MNDVKSVEDRMKKAIEVLKKTLGGIRTSVASPALLDGIHVDYYGSSVSLKQLASISSPEAKLLVLQPFDKMALPEIEKAILKSSLGITPTNDGNVIRLSFPPLTQERRHELVKVIKKDAEDGRVVVRNIRRDAIEHLKQQEKDAHVSKDQVQRTQEEFQKLTDKYIKEIDNFLAAKEKEILTV